MSLPPLTAADRPKLPSLTVQLAPGKAGNEPRKAPVQQSAAVGTAEETDSLLKTKLSKASLREVIERRHGEELRGLPGGVFNAPKLAHLVETMLQRFVGTGMVDPDLKFDVMLASTPDINGWVKMDQSIKDTKVFYVTLTKGLLDLVSDTPAAREMLGPALAAEMAKNGEAIIAAVLAHELGHAMNGDLENINVTTRVFNELAADQFSVELLARAGYAPEAAVDLMRCFDRMHRERSSIASRVAQLTDEHPKPRFRIASLVDLVETLKRTVFARVDFGLPARNLNEIPARPLPRDAANEHESKQGLQGVQRRLESPAYRGKRIRDQLRYLEQYFASYNTQSTIMDRQTAVAIVGAYDAILKQLSTTSEIDQLLVSFRAFLGNISGLAGAKDDRKEGNVRAACRTLKSMALQRKVDLVRSTVGDLNVTSFSEYAKRVDRRFLSGKLIESCRSAGSLAELATLVELRIDNSMALRDEGAGTRSADGLDGVIYRAAVERAIDLTGSLADALDFLQGTLTLKKETHHDESGSSTTISIPGEKAIFTGILRRALERPGIDIGAFVERLQRPKTAADRAYAGIFQRIRFDVWGEVKKERGEAPNLNVSSSNFTYGVGRSQLLHRALTPDLVKLVHLSGGGAAVSHYFNILAGSKYTLVDAIDMVQRAVPQRADVWRGIASKLTAGRGLQRGDDPHSQLRLIVERLVATGIVQNDALAKSMAAKGGFKLGELAGSTNPYLADVHTAVQASQRLHYEQVVDMLGVVSGTSEIVELQTNGPDKPVLTPIPTLSPSNGYLVPPAERVAYIDMVAKAEAVRRLTTYGPRAEASRPVIAEGLDELVNEKRITAAAKDEFLAGIDEVVAAAKNIAAGGGAENDAATYVAMRRLRLMTSVLTHDSINVATKLTLPAVRALNGLSEAGSDRPTTINNARQLLTAFLVASNNELQAYLENPTGTNVEGIGLGIANALAERVAFYEGLGSLTAGAHDLFGFDASTYFARSVHSPRRLGARPQVAFNDGLVMGKANRSRLAPFGPAFEELVTGGVSGHRTGWTSATWYKGLLESAWPYVLHRALTDTDPVHALGFSLGYIESTGSSTEVVNKFSFAMLTRSLELVKSKADMDVFASLFALFVDGTKFGNIDVASFMKADIKEFAKFGQLRYRQHFYDRVVERLDHFQSWRGERGSITSSFFKGCAEIAKSIARRAEKWRVAEKAGYDPILTSLWLARKTVAPSLSDKPWLKKIVEKIKGKASAAYTHCLTNIGFDTGRISREQLFADMQRTNVWSEKVDHAIADYVRADRFEKGWTSGARRDNAVRLTGQVKSLAMREALYRDVLKTHGEVTPTLMTKLKNYYKLYQAAAAAREIWTEPILQELKKTSTIIEAWKITERAWEDFVGERAAERGVDRVSALKLLKDLYDAKVVVDCPPAGEIASIFPEGSAHRDGFIEDYVKSRPMTVEQMTMFQKYKSRNTETPYHKIAKAFFEFIDDEAGRLSTEQRAEVALFLAGVTPNLPSATEDRLNDVLRGNHKRRKVMAQTEAQLRPSELRLFVSQAHPDEKLVAFRGLLLSGVIGDPKAEDVLADKLLFQDPTMPKYLTKLLKLFLNVINPNERSIYLSWLLANSNGKPLSGPEIVRFLVEKGGVVAAKVAQLVASYGFDLPPEYRAALEKFKGKAQKIDKMVFMDECKKRLAADKYDQIKTFDEELGSGSFKIGYAATLKDGRRIVIMMPRAYVIERTAREFEITRNILDAIMLDPDLARDNFAPLRSEVERIVKHEMRFDSEAQYMKDHKANHDARPWLVNVVGGEMKVLVPQPLDGWHTEDILVEEYVDAKGFTKLPERAMFGWSQEKLARAALAEVLNQMMSFMRPDLLKDGKVVLDIDPHEENQLARTSWFGQKQMVNIDLGQSVTIEPEKVRGLVQMLGFIKFGKLDEAVAKAEEYMDFATPAERETFKEALTAKRAANADPFEVLGQTLEETGFAGVFLKPEYLYFQKLFATIVGLKRHIKDPGFIMKRAQRIFALHAIASPSTGTKEVKGGWLELQRLAKHA